MQPRTVTSTPPTPPVQPTEVKPPKKDGTPASIEARAAQLFGKDSFAPTPKKDGGPIKNLGFGDPDDDKFEDIAVGYVNTKFTRGDDKDTMHGIALARGTDIWLPNEYLRMSLEGNGALQGSGSSLAVSGGLALKASVGSSMNVFGFGFPFGVYVKGGPGLNVTNLNGRTSMGIGADMAVGVNILGLDVEMFKTMATNHDATGFRVGVNVKF